MAAPIMTCSGGATCRLSVPAELEAVRETVRLARRFLAEQDVAPQDLIACELALVEASNNAVAYSSSLAGACSTEESSPSPPREVRAGERRPSVEIELCCDSNLVEMHVIDHGPGFDWPDQIELPDSCEEHGRGLFIIKSLMQEAFYLRGRGQNRLIMRIGRDIGDHESHSNAAEAAASAESRKQSGQEQTKRGATEEGPAVLPLLGERAGVRGTATSKCHKAHEQDRDDGNRVVQSAEGSQHPAQASPPERLATVEQKLALSEHVIGTMAKEICFRSEELAAIFRSTSELGGANDLDAFSDRLLNDLLHLASADWFVLRLTPKEGTRLILANASKPALALSHIDLDDHARQSVEGKAARLRSGVVFDEKQPLSADDPLAAAFPGASGLVKPILMGNTLLGTLAIGRDGKQPAFLPSQVQVIQTFSEFLAIQTLNIRLHQEHLDHRLTSRELDIARNIQQSLLPKRFPKLAGYGLSGFCLNARQVGGDFFDVLPLSEDRVLLVIADVMGKGVPAALFAATFHTLIRTVVEWTHRPAEILERVNRLIYEELSGVDMFITAQLIVADTRKRRLLVANAGHCPLLMIRRDNTMEAISPEGMPLGIMPDVVFEQVAIPLADYTAAILYTDGLTEARNAHGEFFGQDRFFKWLQQNHSSNQTAAQLSEAFRAELKSFQGEIALSDDQTFLVLAEEEQLAGIEEVSGEKPAFPEVPARAVATAQG